MLHVYCSRASWEIGKQHGSAAVNEITSGINFYQTYFEEKSKLDWNSAKAAAIKFLPLLNARCPHLIEEMKGLAFGAGRSFEDILVMNCRTEIAMGLMNDGCTSLYWKRDHRAILAQNWDWEHRQQQNLIAIHIDQFNKPAITMITEGGIIGKIGLNSAGVGVGLNAIRVQGIDYDRLPTHLALRTALESESRLDAVNALERIGTGTSVHILIGDSGGGTGLEFSHADVQKLEMSDGKVVHSNHFVLPHHTVNGTRIRESVFLEDSTFRLKRIGDLLAGAESQGLTPSMATVEKQLEDEENFPAAINRAIRPGNEVATLFSVVIDLVAKTARVRMGRPTESTQVVILQPGSENPIKIEGN